MKRMRMPAVIGLALLCGGAGPLTDKSSIDNVLDAMQARGGDLKSFTADVTQTEVDPSSSATTIYHGHVWFQALSGGDARLRYVMTTKQKEKRPATPYAQEYLLDRGVLTDRDGSHKHDTRRQVVAPGQKLDLFELGKGPFPLPIGQDKAKVLREFDVKRVPAAAGDPPHAVHLQLTPKPASSFAREFDTIDFWVDTRQQMPVRIETVGFHGSSDQTNDLANLKVNPPVTDADFTLPPTSGWRPPTDVPYGG